MSLTRLQIFFLAAKYGSMKKAAEVLFVSPPAVTMQIKNMEESLGFRLFTRVGGELRLTERGIRLYHLAEPVFQQLDVLEQYLAGVKEHDNRVLLLGSHHLPCNYFIPDLLAHIHSRYPDLQVQMTLGTQNELLEKLAQKKLDLVLMIGDLENGEDFCATPLFALELVLVTADPSLFGGAACISRKALRDIPLILQQHGSGARRTVVNWLKQCEFSPRIVLDNLSSDVIKQFLPQLRAVAFISRFIVEKDLETGALREIKVKEGLPSVNFNFVYAKTSPLPRKMKDFLSGLEGFTPHFAVL